MEERTRLFFILFIPLVFLLITVVPYGHGPSEYYVTDFNLNLNLNDTFITSTETLTYVITETGFHELYRSYLLDGPQASLQPLTQTCPPGTRYYSQRAGNYLELICRSDSGYSPGTYTLSFTYTIPRPYYCESASGRCVLHWKVLDDFGTRIENINVNVGGETLTFLSTPMPRASSGSSHDLGSIYKGGLMEVFLTTPAKPLSGQFGTLTGLDAETTRYLCQAIPYTWMARHGKLVIFGLTAVEFAVIIYLFFRFSREEEVSGLPEVLHYAPAKRRPYEVSYLFGDRPGKVIDPKAVDATLLDLVRRGHLKLGQPGQPVQVTDLDSAKHPLTPFEARLLDFYRAHPDMTAFKKEISKLSSTRIMDLSHQIDQLNRPLPGMKSEFTKIYDPRASWWVTGLMAGFLVLSLVLASLFASAAPYLIFLLISQAMLMAFKFMLDTYVFGKYTREAIKERREWEAFRKLLSDYSMMEKYQPEDLSMWGEWLVFATLFGTADKVLKRMATLRVSLPYLPPATRGDMSWFYYSALRSHARAQLATKTASSGARGFSGGVGGGFGGGGGGAR
ncbi:MAG TPA: DUF2207 domain-containing protein [archaeon]|nr:DUF2207 domain-containing protein [archaeon]